MSNPGLEQFAGQKYLNLESYRKSGAPVQTPMWFAEEGGVIFAYSLANSGKVKRIRNNARVRIAPCTVRGKLVGDWLEATAVILGESEAKLGHRLLNAKYLSKWFGDIFSKLMGRKQVVLAIHPSGGCVS